MFFTATGNGLLLMLVTDRLMKDCPKGCPNDIFP